ncbi:hypothetical protein [Erythrobacter sp.]|jgi:hypothetical protein|uniref:hypothetical protein n=1 Tax=Erythrobacter sp. TaxID=1042 RepID=UPI002EAA2AF3|nr:hypothetical protein [Erythrobacter sp.]
MRFALLAGLALIGACKPPPSDAGLSREVPEAEPTFASAPLPSPDSEGAVWARSQAREGRIVYGVPGEAALLALECLGGTEAAAVQMTRIAVADEGAGALLAMVGNGHIGRLPVDARAAGDANIWQGEAAASDSLWEPLRGPRALTVTVPGAGMVRVNGSELPGDLIAQCRED